MQHDQPFMCWVQDAADALACLLADILAGRISEDDIAEDFRFDLRVACKDILAADEALRRELSKAQSDAFFDSYPDHDPHAGLRHPQYERR